MASQVKRNHTELHIGIRLKPRFRACVGVHWRGIGHRIAVRSQANRVESRVGDAKLKRLSQASLHDVPAELQIVLTARIGKFTSTTNIHQPPLLGKCRRGVSEDVRARIIMDLILTYPAIHRQQRIRVERVLVARRDVERQHSLALILLDPIVCVRDLKPIPRSEQIQMEHVFAARLIIETVDERSIIADGVEWHEFRCVEVAPGSRTGRRQKIAELR